jgi:small-conductance mechanosensitive channel
MVAVKTSEELRKAIENNEDEILIDDEDLARKMLQFKRMKIITKRGLIGVAVVAIFGILLSFFFGEVPALLAAALTSLAVGLVVIETFLGMGLIGTAALYALYKVYSIDLVGCSKLTVRITRIK